MKSFFTTLPLVVLLAGCGAPAAQNDGANATGANAVDPNANANANAANNAAESTSSAATSESMAAGADYKVVDEAQPGLPPEAVTALKKAKVPPPPAATKVPDKARVRLVTSQGPITLELNGRAAPLHVKSFLYLARRGFFNGTQWHRYEPGFVIQGGDPLTKNPKLSSYYGIGGPGYQIPREYNELKHVQFVVAAARSKDPNSAGSQFYITLEAAPFLDEGDGYTVFGKVVAGQANVLKLRQGAKLRSVVALDAAPQQR